MNKENEKTATQIIEEVKAEICDKYCKYPESKDKDQDEIIDKICVNCPLGRI